MNCDLNHIVKKLVSIRKSRGITQMEWANLAGLYQSGISKYEIGEKCPDFSTLVKMADALGYRIEVTLVNETPPHPDSNKGVGGESE